MSFWRVVRAARSGQKRQVAPNQRFAGFGCLLVCYGTLAPVPAGKAFQRYISRCDRNCEPGSCHASPASYIRDALAVCAVNQLRRPRRAQGF